MFLAVQWSADVEHPSFHGINVMRSWLWPTKAAICHEVQVGEDCDYSAGDGGGPT